MRDIVPTDVTRNLPIELVNKIMLYRPPNACVSQLNYYKKEWLYQINREYLFRFHEIFHHTTILKIKFFFKLVNFIICGYYTTN